MTNQEDRDNNEREALMDFIRRSAAKLGEHFGSVRIVATREVGGSTEAFTAGSGNVYAQIGSVMEWLEKEREQCRIEQRGDQDED